jgi:hypothetical protein
MLRRTLSFAGRPDGAGERDITGGPFVATRLLDGFGSLSPAPPDAQPIPAEAFATARPSAATPPGLYERAGVSAAIDAAASDEALTPLRLPAGIARAGLGATIERPLAGWLFGLAGLMLAIDLLIALLLIGRLPRLARTGDASIDRTSAAGLQALSDVLTARTSVEPGPPTGVDLARDNLAAYPFLYWPATSSPQRLSDAALANVDRYLAIGGLLLVDTRDASGARGRPAATMLSGIDIPPLELVDTEHVLARAFYLLRSFPGRTQATQLWAESANAASSRDGVAAIFIGNGDWAAAWAGNAGNERQRELALRFGVNLVMVALTGNYKADQVHVPALLERMGED